MRNKVIKKLVINAIILSMFCALGMFSFSFGENIKVSLQLLFIFIIGLLDILDIFDCLEITIGYLLIGLVLPIYAGFNVGITQTFGYVISFVIVSAIIKIINNLLNKKINKKWVTCFISCFIGLIIVYMIGTLFMSIYLSFEDGFWKLILITVLPYLPFDIIKMVIAYIITLKLNNILNKKESSNF